MTAMKQHGAVTAHNGKAPPSKAIASDEEREQAAPTTSSPTPTPSSAARSSRIHHAAREVVRSSTEAKVGWTIAAGALTAHPAARRSPRDPLRKEDIFWEGSRGDDFVGVQAYSSQQVDANGLVPHPEHPDNTLVGTAYRPDALAWRCATPEVTGASRSSSPRTASPPPTTPQRIRYTDEALCRATSETIAEGIDVRGYLHWSLLDNFEWGHWEPTFGLVAVDRDTFERTPKPSLAWLGQIAQHNAIPTEVLA